MKTVANELSRYKLDLVAVQEVKRDKFGTETAYECRPCA
jgi:mRNA deadenylase 3'-5' endonuclease subunit Ccr4